MASSPVSQMMPSFGELAARCRRDCAIASAFSKLKSSWSAIASEIAPRTAFEVAGEKAEEKFVLGQFRKRVEGSHSAVTTGHVKCIRGLQVALTKRSKVKPLKCSQRALHS